MMNTTKRRNFRLDIPDNGALQSFQWQIQQANIPSVNMEIAPIKRGPQYAKLDNNNIAGSGTSFDDLNIQFLVDENLETYAELLKWLLTMNNPTGASNHDGKVPSLLLLHILDNNGEDIVATFKFVNPFPKTLSDIEWNYTESGDVDSVVCDVTFEYAYFEMIHKINGKEVTITPFD